MPDAIVGIVVAGLFILGLVTLRAKVLMMVGATAVVQGRPSLAGEARGGSPPDPVEVRGWESEGDAMIPEDRTDALDVPAGIRQRLPAMLAARQRGW